MARVQSALAKSLADIASDPPDSVADAASAWANATQSYFSGLVPPASAALPAAASKLKQDLEKAFADHKDGAAKMDTAFQAFAAALAAGMTPANFTGTPPTSVIGFETLFKAPFSETSQGAADKLAQRIHLWASSGTAVQIAPPAAAINWA